MTPENYDAGMAILQTYETVRLHSDGKYRVTNVLCEVVSFEDQQKLVSLGWTGLDDWIGYESNLAMEHHESCRICQECGPEECPRLRRPL